MTASVPGTVVEGPDEIRFRFGANWKRFLATLTDQRLDQAASSLKAMLKVPDLGDKTFLDVGSGSGLFSLSAMRLGARAVRSFDYDADSVECARDLKRRFYADDPRWSIGRGSVLDAPFMASLGTFDVVYAWGVLHHTGDMQAAMENVAPRVAPKGLLFIALYNDQGWRSRAWARIKRMYSSNRALRAMITAVFVPYFVGGGLAADVWRRRNPLTRYRAVSRGMSIRHDWSDWLGGYPFEVAKPDDIVAFYGERGFDLRTIVTCGRKHGCNEFVFSRR